MPRPMRRAPSLGLSSSLLASRLQTRTLLLDLVQHGRAGGLGDGGCGGDGGLGGGSSAAHFWWSPRRRESKKWERESELERPASRTLLSPLSLSHAAHPSSLGPLPVAWHMLDSLSTEARLAALIGLILTLILCVALAAIGSAPRTRPLTKKAD